MTEEGITQLRPGVTFHQRYRVVRRIAAGGMGAVYEVVDDRTDSPRALKVMLAGSLADPDLRARFTLEAKVTGNIASDHIVRVSDAGVDDATGTPFLVMELLRGEDLGSLIAKRGPLPPAEVVLYLHQAALALDKTHAAGIVHRDLKPENLFVTYRDDGSPCVKILDFGIAKVVARSAARTTRAVGTPMFMAPEQIQGDASIGAPADLFSLAHIAYTLLTAEPYWNQEVDNIHSVATLLAKMMMGMPEAPVARALRRRGVVLPPAFDAWMQMAVAFQPEARFDRATVEVAALADALGVTGVPGVPAGLPSLGPPWSFGSGGGARAAGTAATLVSEATATRSKRPVAVGVAILAVLGVGGAVALRLHFAAAGASSAGPGASVEPSRARVVADPPPPVVTAEPGLVLPGAPSAAALPEPVATTSARAKPVLSPPTAPGASRPGGTGPTRPPSTSNLPPPRFTTPL